GTARGRLGWANDGALIYVTAGGAWAGIDETDTIAVAVTPPPVGATTTASFSNTKSGYAVGAGIEMRLWANWTAKVEYLHIDLGGTTNTGVHNALPFIGPNLILTTTTGRIKDDIFRVGLNWKFGGYGGVMAAY